MVLDLDISRKAGAPYSIIFLSADWAADWAAVQTKTAIPPITSQDVLSYLQPPVQIELRQISHQDAGRFITGERRQIPLAKPRVSGRIKINNYPAWVSEMLRFAAQQSAMWMLAGNMFWWKFLHESDNDDDTAEAVAYRESWPFNVDVTTVSGDKWLSYMKKTAIKLTNAKLTKFQQKRRGGDAVVSSEIQFDCVYEGSVARQATAPPASIRPSRSPSFTTADPLLFLSQEVARASDRFNTTINIYLPNLNL